MQLKQNRALLIHQPGLRMKLSHLRRKLMQMQRDKKELRTNTKTEIRAGQRWRLTMEESEQGFFSHLEELRRRLIISMLAWVGGFGVCYSFSQQLFEFVSLPVRASLPPGSSLVFIHATEPFFTYLKISAVAGLLLA